MRTHKILYSKILPGLVFGLALSLGLAWISNGQASLVGWPGCCAAILAAAGLFWLGYRPIYQEAPPGWLLWLAVGAVLLRLAAGVFWTYALPQWGYPNETQQAGYIMFDAYLRDGQAWQLSQSGVSLLEAFRGYTAHDQYGGILFLSALVYRLLGTGQHMPLLVVVFTSTFSGVGVLWLWGFARKLYGSPVDRWAALGLALYPEAVLLGSTQMREAFTVTFGVGLAYLLHRYYYGRKTEDLLLLGILAAVTAAFSWTYLVLVGVILLLLLISFIAGKVSLTSLTRKQLALLGLGGIVLVAGGSYLWSLLSRMSDFQGYLTEAYSGVVQAVFSRLPAFLHTPFLVTYGMTRPLLSAAVLGKGSRLLWRGIGIWRALGWTVVFVLLLYATLFVLRKRKWLSTTTLLLAGNWVMISIASFRAGGDLWDNPRYRVGFAAFQILLCAWALVKQKEEKDPWLRRVLVSGGIILIWIVLWYLPRSFPVSWRSGGILDSIALGLFTSVVYLLVDWLLLTPPGEEPAEHDPADHNPADHNPANKPE
jgi:hypothetical protein